MPCLQGRPSPSWVVLTGAQAVDGTDYSLYFTSLTCETISGYFIQFQASQCRKDIMSKFSRGPPGWLGLEYLACEERPKNQGQFSRFKRRFQGDLIAALHSHNAQNLQSIKKTEPGSTWWCMVGGQKSEAIYPGFLPYKYFFTMRTVKQCLPTEVVQSPSCEVSKA